MVAATDRKLRGMIRVNFNADKRGKLLADLPAAPLTEALKEAFNKTFEQTLAPIMRDALLEEIEIFRAIDKPNNRFNLDSFNPTTNGDCFMGQGFFANGDMIDEDLEIYRKRVGTIEHPVWGNCTLLEIWGADHFNGHRDMVRSVWEYVTGKTDAQPEIAIHVNAFGYSLAAHQQSENYEIIQEAMNKAMCFDHGISRERYQELKDKGKL